MTYSGSHSSEIVDMADFIEMNLLDLNCTEAIYMKVGEVVEWSENLGQFLRMK